jgi:hypothetical protein
MLLVDHDSHSGKPPPAGPEQGVIEEARRRRRARRLRASLAALFTALAVAGALIAGMTGGTARTEASLHLPPEPWPPLRPHAAPGSVIVQLSPYLEGSEAGWCVMVVDRVGDGGGTCGPPPTRGHPTLGAGSGWSAGEPDVTTTEITAPEVAYVLVNGHRRVPTVASPGLPYGLRVAAVHTPLTHHFPPMGPVTTPRLVSLDSQGHRIRESPSYGDGLPFRDWNRPGAPAKGVCELRASGIAVTAEWGQVATAIHPYPGRIVGRGFLSCVDTEYYVPGRGMRAAVLLDAASPGRVLPAEIPGVTPVPQAPAFYNGTGDYSFKGPMSAKREGDAWIVVAGGGRNAEESRIRLLRHLTARIEL